MKLFKLLFIFVFISSLLNAQNVSFLEFDGDDSFYVNDNSSNDLDVTGSNWTLECWVYPTANTVPASGSYPSIISRKYSVEMYFRNTGSGTTSLGVGVIALSGSGSGFDVEATVTSGTNELTLNEWHHIAVSYDGTTTRLFFDGSVVGTSTDADFDLDASIAAMNFGVRYDGGYDATRYIDDCALDEIRYSKTARYTTDFTIGTASSPFTTDANTILLYHLNEGTGTSIANDGSTDFNTSLRSSPNDATWRTYNYYSDELPLQFVIDGNMKDDLYISLATKQNSNSGFGSAIDVSEIKYYNDADNEMIYLGVIGKLNTGSTDGIGIWLNTDSDSPLSGASAGTALGITGGGHYIDGDAGSHLNFKADFEVDYMFALNPGASSSNVYFDAATQLSSAAAHYQGACDQAGTSATNSSADGTVFTQNAITFAFDNSAGSTTGFEVALPYSELGISSLDNLEVFAFVVSSTAYFSDVTVPGDITTGNPGQDVDFGSLSGGDFHAGTAPVPVELNSFVANINGDKVTLTWRTATEVNNYGFEIQRQAVSNENSEWEAIGFVEGAGNSNSPKSYSFTDNVSASGKYSYRLKQIDLDGTFEYSDVVEVNIGTPVKFELSQNYPNPFNPTTTISYSIPSVIARSPAMAGTQSIVNVALTVYNALGQKVATLVNKEQAPGNYTVQFDATDLASGVYFYTLHAGKFVATKKMILMK